MIYYCGRTNSSYKIPELIDFFYYYVQIRRNNTRNTSIITGTTLLKFVDKLANPVSMEAIRIITYAEQVELLRLKNN